MATYVPNALDATQPTGDKKVSSAAPEFRTAKTTLKQTLRVPEASVPVLPTAVELAGKFLVGLPGGGFGASTGTGGGDETLRADLAAPTGAGGVGSDDGASGTLWTTVAGFIARIISSAGASVVGFIQDGIGAVATSVQNRLRDSVSAFDFMTEAQIADVRAYAYTLNVSEPLFRAQQAAQAKRVPLRVYGGGYLASLALRANDVAVIGDGSAVTRLKLPSEAIAITSMVRASNLVTVNCAAPHGAWVGKGVRVAGCATTTFNYGYIVTSIPTTTQLVCQQLNESQSDDTATTASLYEASVLDCGELCNGNAATAYSGLRLSGLTLDGNKANRAASPNDLSDWGLILTKFSEFHISDVVGIDCLRGGIGLVINSNNGYICARAESSGTADGSTTGFDFNSSKYVRGEVTAKDCPYGARVIDNCWNNQLKVTVENATTTGFIYGNQTTNISYCNNFDLTIRGGCTIAGVQVGAKVRGGTIKASVADIAGVGFQEVVQASAVNAPEGVVYDISVNNCGSQGAIVGGNSGIWRIAADRPGRTGAQGAHYAVDVYGNLNTLTVSLIDDVDNSPTTLWQCRGVQMRSGATQNRLLSFRKTNEVGAWSDLGTKTTFVPRTFRGSTTWDVPSTAAGAVASTTVSVPGAASGDGDIVQAILETSLAGQFCYAASTATDVVTVYMFNASGGVLDPVSANVRVIVTKRNP